ncbi:MAG: asparagine synthetase B [Gemmatales bacterium]|nr:MAG: asparagine synthetase B [Gemmatales bacterium]
MLRFADRALHRSACPQIRLVVHLSDIAETPLMCGIAGLTGANHAPERVAEWVRAVRRLLRHRGPDDDGMLQYSRQKGSRLVEEFAAARDAEALLLHWRLSILDLSSAGRQPMACPEQRFFIVFNGEIYNYLELRAELEKIGHRFQTGTDTEVLLAAYKEWGKDCLTRLVGMFAFAVLDAQTRRLFLARDFFGIKPLYYATWQGGFAFASEAKALLPLPGIGRDIHPRRLFDYLSSGLTDHGEYTMFADIRQVPSAHYLEIALDQPKQSQPKPYWQAHLQPRCDLSRQEAAKKVRELFLENIQLHLRSDVPVGAALSGGIDSSAVVCAIRHLNPRLELHTFSYLADDPTLSEERWARIVGASCQVYAHEVHAVPDELVADLDHLVSVQDEPFGSTSIYAQYRVFRLAKEAGIKVMLDGQGADELLGGYRSYLSSALASLVRKGHLRQARKLFRRAAAFPDVNKTRLLVRAAVDLMPIGLHHRLRHIVGKDRFPPWLDAGWFKERGVEPRSVRRPGGPDVLRRDLHQSVMQTSLPMLLRFEDRNSMAHSIESRVPFLTPKLADFLLSLPEDFIIDRRGTSKSIFREAMRGIVPDAILDRRDKIGFATPEKRWLAALKPWVDKVLHSDTARCIPALNMDNIEREWHAVLAGKAPFDFRIWRWVNLIRWADQNSIHFS